MKTWLAHLSTRLIPANPTDAVTGDILTPGEWMSWKVQGLIRRWTFLVLVTIVTILVWSTNQPTALVWWNLAASYLAILIESIVGIAMFSQTRRDAVVLREIRAIAARIETLEQRTFDEVEELEIRLEGEA